MNSLPRTHPVAAQERTPYQKSLVSMTSGAGIVSLGLIIGTGLEYITRIALARILAPAAYGLFELSYSIVLFGSMFSLLGMGTSLARFVAYYKESDSLATIKGAIVGASRINAVAIVTTFLILWFGAGYMAQELFAKPALEPILKLFLLGLPLMSVSALILAALRGFTAMKQWIIAQNLAVNIFRFSAVAALLMLLPHWANVTTVVIIYVLSFALRTALSWFYLRQYPPLQRSVQADLSITPHLVRFSLPLMVSDVMSEMRRNLEVLLLGFFATSRDIGIFSAAAIVSQLINVPSIGLERVFMPVASGLYAKGQVAQVHGLFKTSARWMFYLTTPPLVCLLLFAEPVTLTLFGQAYRGTGSILVVLVIGYFANAATGLWEPMLLAKGKTVAVMSLRMVWIGSSVLTALLLIPRMGVMGAAWSVSLPFVIMNTLGVVVLFIDEAVQPFQWMMLSFGVATVVLCAGFDLFVTRVAMANAFVVLLLPIVCGACYWLALQMAKRDSDDRYVVALALHRLKRITPFH